jgi:hypothetical protein
VNPIKHVPGNADPVLRKPATRASQYLNMNDLPSPYLPTRQRCLLATCHARPKADSLFWGAYSLLFTVDIASSLRFSLQRSRRKRRSAQSSPRITTSNETGFVHLRPERGILTSSVTLPLALTLLSIDGQRYVLRDGRQHRG